MTNRPATLSNRAAQALTILEQGGTFRHGLERNSYTGREQFAYRLQTKEGQTVKGIGGAAFGEIERLLVATNRTSVSTTYKLMVPGL
jgi:hypothetical protein